MDPPAARHRAGPATGLAVLALFAGLGGAAVPLSGWLHRGEELRDREWRAVDAELAELRDEQERARARIARQDHELEAAKQRIQELHRELAEADRRQGELGQDLQGLEAQVRVQSATLAAHRAPDPAARRAALLHDVLRPVFQLSGADAVGSAVLVARIRDPEDPHYLALSCYHVVRDVLGQEIGEIPDGTEVPGSIDTGGREVPVRARLLAHDIELDLALLRIDGDRDLGPTARLGSAAECAEIGPFTPIYTVGCPLGTAAQATHGEVTRTRWEVGGEKLWMISSPAYFGNSGGGVFRESDHRLIGIFAKIYTHGSYRPQVITHMGLAIPLPVLLGWLDEIGYRELSEPARPTR